MSSGRPIASPHPNRRGFDYEAATKNNQEDTPTSPHEELVYPSTEDAGVPPAVYNTDDELTSESSGTEDCPPSPRRRRLARGEKQTSTRRFVDFKVGNQLTQHLTEKNEYNPRSRARGILSRKHPPEGMTTQIEEAVRLVNGLTQAEAIMIKQRMRQGEELTQFNKGSGPRRRMVRITEDGSEIKYVDAGVATMKRKSFIGKAASTMLRKQRPLAEAHCLVYGRCPVSIRGEHDAALTFSIRFHTDKWNVLKNVHFGCTDDAQLIRWFMGLQMLIPMTKWHITKSRLAWLRIKLKLRTKAVREHKQPEKLLDEIIQEARKVAFETKMRDRRQKELKRQATQEQREAQSAETDLYVQERPPETVQIAERKISQRRNFEGDILDELEALTDSD